MPLGVRGRADRIHPHVGLRRSEIRRNGLPDYFSRFSSSSSCARSSSGNRSPNFA